MMGAGVVTSARVTHDGACVDDIADASPESQSAAVATLLTRPEIEEAFVLSTCNRVEAYVVAPDAAVGQAALEDVFEVVDDDAVYWADHDESLRHLLRVAAGLESVVVGEDQIIGQVRRAYEDARRSGGIGPMLETAVTKAIHVGERARTETAINEGIVSLGSAATALAADDIDGGLEGTTALVVGAGEMGRLAARSLDDAGANEVIVANRTVSHADHVVSELAADGDAVGLEAIDTIVSRAEVVVAATGSIDPVLEAGHLDADDREQVVVDLGQPRDVCPTAASLPSVTVYDLDDLESVTERTREQRADAAADVEAIIDEEFVLLLDQYKRTRADEVIAAMYESAERVKQREVETAISRLEANQGGELTDGQREIVESMADALVSQLLAPPTKSLREAAAEDDWGTINTALQLFDPEFGPESPVSALESESKSKPESESESVSSFGAVDDD
ncbi:glutamyl-tRNA reductase [Halobacteria archaeon AArc-m2/3/4]|uniref:Glutamyl-tRNA reductase n=1 Tax=Natronoglomus mannanivorans TaxID=2979990 RepID=A0ABT2QIG2_9EURY|nr:glutamyl-tRNA reductase [Halobacteria archaeon AArc-m2/3/4]